MDLRTGYSKFAHELLPKPGKRGQNGSNFGPRLVCCLTPPQPLDQARLKAHQSKALEIEMQIGFSKFYFYPSIRYNIRVKGAK